MPNKKTARSPGDIAAGRKRCYIQRKDPAGGEKGGKAPVEEISVLLAEPDERLREEWAAGFRLLGGLWVAGMTGQAEEVLPLLRASGAQVLILEPLLDAENGLALLERVRGACGERLGILVCTALARPSVLARARRLGADGALAKPVDLFTLAAWVRLACRKCRGNEEWEASLRARAALLLGEQGVSPRGKGRALLLEALCLTAREPEVLREPAAVLCARLSSRCGVPAGSAARDMRAAIRRAWAEGSALARQKYFPWQCRLGRCPTTAEFLTVLSERLRRPMPD